MLRLAGEVARSEARRATAGLAGRARLSVEARVRRAYYELLLARELLALIEDRSRSWRQIEGVVRERYATGLAVQQDLLRAQVEVLRLEQARAEQAAAVANRRFELNRALGRSQAAALEITTPLEYRDALPDSAELLGAVRQRSPEVAASAVAIGADELRVRLARKQFFPDFVAGGGPMLRGPIEPMWQATLGLSLPLYAFSRQSNQLREAKASLRSTEAIAASVAQELELRTRERLQSLRAALRVASLYRDGLLPADQNSFEAAVASYRTGRVPFVTVLEALNALYADRAAFLARLAEAEKWRIAIDEADLQPSGGMAAGGEAVSPGAVTASPEGQSGGMNRMR